MNFGLRMILWTVNDELDQSLDPVVEFHFFIGASTAPTQSPGVYPNALRNHRVKCAWSAKPQSAATVARGPDGKRPLPK